MSARESTIVHEVRMVPVEKVKLDPTNPNVMSNEQLEGLRESMRRFGYLDPVILDQDFMVADGEHRLKIYKEFGFNEIPCYVLQLGDPERRLLRQTMNKLRGSHDLLRDAAELKILFDTGRLDDLAHLIAGNKDDYLRLLENYYNIPYQGAEASKQGTKINPLPIGEFHQILQGDIRRALKQLPESSVDCVMTSPPYWALRNYGKAVEVDWDDGWHGQLGLEPNYRMFVEHLVECLSELKRVLCHHGSLYVNIGDTYWGGGHENNFDALPKAVTKKQPRGKYERAPDYLPQMDWSQTDTVQPKSLIGIPQRFMLAMMDDGWICRNVIIWHKPNHMPTSVKDRFSTGYEFIFFFVKQEEYYFDLDSVREPHTSVKDLGRMRGDTKTPKHDQAATSGAALGPSGYLVQHSRGKNPGDVVSVSPQLGKGWANNPGHQFGHQRKFNPDADGSDYWEITTRPFPGAHFATFPPALVVRPLKASCPSAVCSKCGRPVLIKRSGGNPAAFNMGNDPARNHMPGQLPRREKKVHGLYDPRRYTSPVKETIEKCDCNAPFRPGVIMDPFAGSGTVGMVARQFHRSSISIELNPRYCDMIKQRIGFENKTVDGKLVFHYLKVE